MGGVKAARAAPLPPVVQQAIQAAAAQIDQGALNAAAATVQQGLRAAPEHPELLHLAGQVAVRMGDPVQGKQLIRRAIKLAPRTGLFHYNLGSILLTEGDFEGAKTGLRQAIRFAPALADAYTNLAIACVQQRQHEEAEAAFREAIRRQPDNPHLYLNLAVCCMELRRPDKAEQALANAESVATRPDAGFLHRIGNSYRSLGRPLVAEAYYRRALALDGDNADYWFALGDVLSTTGDYDGALQALEKVRELDPDSLPLALPMARVVASRGDLQAAKVLLAQALSKAGDDPSLILNIAREYSDIGEFQSQEACLRKALSINPDYVEAIVALAALPGQQLDDADAARLRKLADDRGLDAATRRSIGFGLGDYYRYAKRFDDSFRFYRLGNQLKGYRFDRGAHAAWVARMEGLFDAAYFAERADWGSDSRLPVLIVGLPRSGTTLAEQILSAHPQVLGAGEYGGVAALAAVDGLPIADFRVRPELVGELDRDQVARYAAAYLGRMQALVCNAESIVTNKLPNNFLQLGLFGLLFPHAPVIQMRRDPRDNLLSIFFQDFAGYHDYAYDLKDLGHYYRLYERLMAHWTAVIPNPVMTLQYEDLVADLPARAAAMAGFLDIDFDERMLRFYEQQRKVETASKWQVRQPLYSSSVARWKPYERHLKPLFELLDAK